jgi:hypothetical protein
MLTFGQALKALVYRTVRLSIAVFYLVLFSSASNDFSG